MDRTTSVSPPISLSAISHVNKVVVLNSTFNLDQRNANQSQSSVDDDRQIPDWLTQIDFSIVQNDMFSKHTVGTGTWFVEHQTYQKWLSSEIPSVLWVKGMLGAGKTILSSIVINHLERSFPNDQEDNAIIFAYCRHSDRYSSTDILASFVKQLAQRRSGVLSLVESVYTNRLEAGTPPRPEELLDMLQEYIPLFKNVYMIVDAFDEFPEDTRDEFLKALVSLPARLLLTSRPPMSSYLLDGKPCLEIGDENQKDIEFFIDQKFEESTSLKTILRQKEQVWSEIRAKLKKTSAGMFLITPFQIESLKSCTTVNELRKAAGSLSSDIGDTYSSTWARIKAQSEKCFSLATRAIIWLVYACRQLKISELQHAVAETFEDDDIAPEETILSVCCGLIVVDRESQKVRFVHITALDFFKKLGRSVHPTPHALITKRCISYLQASQLTRCEITSKKELRAFLNVKKRPLRDYAYHHWAYHTRSSYEEVDQLHAVSDFLEKCGKYPCIVNETFDLFQRPHIIAYYGLQGILSLGNAECNQLTSIMEFTPFILACTQGNEEGVKDFLSCKVNVNTYTKNGHTALYTASLNGHQAVVRLLLSHEDVTINTQTKDPWRVLPSGLHRPVNHKVAVKTRDAALLIASSMGHEAVVELLLTPGFKKGIHVNTLMEDDQTALYAASRDGHKAVVKLLLDHKDIAVNTQTKDGRTALLAASSNGHTPVVKLLTSRPDIAVNMQDKDGETALLAASSKGHDEVVGLLLSLPDIAVNTEMKGGRTALFAASSEGHTAVVKLLTPRPDIAVNTETKSGWTALSAASCGGHTAVVQLLLDHKDIDVNKETIDGQTALFAASRDGHEAVAKLLLDHKGIDVNRETIDGQTALFAVSRDGHEAVAKLLLDHKDIAVNTQTKDGWTALSAASNNGHTSVVDLLLDHKNIAINTQTNDGWTALSVASDEGHKAIVELLVSHKDIAINTQAEDGSTALISAAMKGHEAVVNLLLSVRVTDINAETIEGWTALSAASIRGHTKVVKLLLFRTDIAVNTQTNGGFTAFSAAKDEGHEAVVELLRSHPNIDVNIQTEKGGTTLSASDKGRAGVFGLLSQGGRTGLRAAIRAKALHLLNAAEARSSIPNGTVTSFFSNQ